VVEFNPTGEKNPNVNISPQKMDKPSINRSGDKSYTMSKTGEGKEKKRFLIIRNICKTPEKGGYMNGNVRILGLYQVNQVQQAQKKRGKE